MKKITPVIIGSLLLITWGVVLRLYQFGNQPAALNRDEAALGYNAWTIATRGVDEWGKRLPLIFTSFGDDKLPGYIYTLVPLIKLFGISDTVIRLPSLLAGLILIWLAYGLTQQLTGNREVALAAAAITAVSPWAIFYSRVAFEAHLALMWLLLSLYLLELPPTWRRRALSLLSYIFAVFTYNTPLLLAPIIVIFIWFKQRVSIRQKLSLVVPVILIALIGLVILGKLTGQKQNITIFADPTIQEQIRQGYHAATTLPEKLVAHRFTQYAILSGQRLLASLGPVFLVFKGGSHPWHTVPGTGHLTFTGYLMCIGSLVLIFSGQVRRRRGYLSWFLLSLGALLPAVVTVDAPHATRSLLFLFLTGILAPMVLTKWPKLLLPVMVGLLCESSLYAYRYFIVYPRELPGTWPQHIEAAITSATTKQEAEVIYITNGPGSAEDLVGDQIYIYALLYSHRLPATTLPYEQQPHDSAGMVRMTRASQFIITNDAQAVPPGQNVIERNMSGIYQVAGLKKL